MLSAGYFHPFSSRVAASVVGMHNNREGQRSGYQLHVFYIATPTTINAFSPDITYKHVNSVGFFKFAVSSVYTAGL
jgi:hypothetical protein